MTCPRGQQEIPTKAYFCTKCGTRLTLACAKCNTEVWSGRGPYSLNCAARQRSAAPSPSFSRISSNFVPTSVRAA